MFTFRERPLRIASACVVAGIVAVVPSFAQNAKSLITGSVADTTGAGVPGAQIQLAPVGIIAVSNSQGLYSLPGVPAGKYSITVSYIGFETLHTEVEVTAGEDLSLDLKMKVASSGEEVIVTAERPRGEAEAINQTRTADNIVQVLPAEVIRSLPNANVADAIGRLPSVTLYRIEGEGVYIQVRGTEPRLTNVTVDGVTLPSPEPTVRQVRLDVLPSDLGRCCRTQQNTVRESGRERHWWIGKSADQGSRRTTHN